MKKRRGELERDLCERSLFYLCSSVSVCTYSRPVSRSWIETEQHFDSKERLPASHRKNLVLHHAACLKQSRLSSAATCTVALEVCDRSAEVEISAIQGLCLLPWLSGSLPVSRGPLFASICTQLPGLVLSRQSLVSSIR